MLFGLVGMHPALANEAMSTELAQPSLTGSFWAMLALGVFILAYGLVIAEENIHLRKSKPMVIAAGVIWVLVALAFAGAGQPEAAGALLKEVVAEYAELLLFLLAAMTFINVLQERGLFDALRSWLVSRGFSLRTIFWLTGVLAFFISPIADNLTTALIMGAVVMAVAGTERRFVVPALISIVVAANAGGAFSPFGDITTLMVWQKGMLQFHEFFALFIPSLVNWLVPAFIRVKQGGFIALGLFIASIALAVVMHNELHLPPMLGLMTGLGALMVLGYFIRRGEGERSLESILPGGMNDISELTRYFKPKDKPFDIFISMKRAEWDTLLFFYGVILSVGGLGALGYLAALSNLIYVELGATTANVLVGLLSAVVDNIPVMYAVLSMNPDMSHGQWLLVTLTAGVGGSLLSVGSAAGVGLMGQARGVYTFMAHMRWSWAVLLGYVASILTHLSLNASLM
ncbi:MAG: sodium:proton antiporter [Gammaproteobacteria bacterium 28-57-27]|nr:MAG: sodium:proton antiporter [Gammaproteobacteria bacterium 28-57-27]